MSPVWGFISDGLVCERTKNQQKAAVLNAYYDFKSFLMTALALTVEKAEATLVWASTYITAPPVLRIKLHLTASATSNIHNIAASNGLSANAGIMARKPCSQLDVCFIRHPEHFLVYSRDVYALAFIYRKYSIMILNCMFCAFIKMCKGGKVQTYWLDG